MASTYSDLKIELIGTGEQVGSWGTTTNTNLGTAIEEAITGSVDISFSSADVTLTLTNTNGTQSARNLRLVCTGTSGGARNLILDSGCQINKLYLVQNDLADAVTVINGDGAGGTSGTGVAIPVGGKRFVFNNGTNVVLATNVSLTADVLGTLPVANGGTGATTLTANNVLLGNGTSAPQFVAPGTSGNVLTSNGTTWTSVQGFVQGMIMLWSGTIATIPSGWALCDGNNGTPDLTNKFIIGADADDGGVAKTNVEGSYTQDGGDKDAIVVLHNHTATSSSSVSDPGHFHYSRSYSTGTEQAGQGTATSATFVDRVQVNTSAPDSSTRPTASATTGISVSTSTTVNNNGSSGTNANLPPYFALAYIMKL